MSQRRPDSLQSRCAYFNSSHVVSCSYSCSVRKCFPEQSSIVDCVFIYLVCCPQSSWWNDGVSCFSLSPLCLISLDNRPHNWDPRQCIEVCEHHVGEAIGVKLEEVETAREQGVGLSGFGCDAENWIQGPRCWASSSWATAQPCLPVLSWDCLTQRLRLAFNKQSSPQPR